jgi:3D (Asp-Asp-Asp) domain-containing protein
VRRIGWLVPLLLLACADHLGRPHVPQHGTRASLGWKFTYYWVTTEVEFEGLPDTDLIDPTCRVLAAVPAGFARSLTMEGTGLLGDGRLVNYAPVCLCGPPCFYEPGDLRPFGVGVEDRPLVPFRSVAVDQRLIPIGTHLFVPELSGQWVPGEAPWGGFFHDGCVVADDRGSHITNRHLDFFAAYQTCYKALDRTLGRRTVTVEAGDDRCP